MSQSNTDYSILIGTDKIYVIIYCDDNGNIFIRTATIIREYDIISPSHNISVVLTDLQTYCFREYFSHTTITRY